MCPLGDMLDTAHMFCFRRVIALANKLDQFHLLYDSNHGLEGLINTPLNDGKKWSVFLDIDCGLGRSKQFSYLIVNRTRCFRALHFNVGVFVDDILLFGIALRISNADDVINRQ